MARNPEHGFGIHELLISILISSVVLSGVYTFSNKSTRTTTFATNLARLSQDARKLRATLDTDLRNIGYNPQLVPYNVEKTGSDRDQKRIGAKIIQQSKFEFTSDDNVLVGTDPSIGLIGLSEQYGYWVEDTLGNQITFDGKTDPSGEPCTPANDPADPTKKLTFSTPYRLMGKMKTNSSNPSSEVATVPTVLSDKVLCFEVRYFTPGDTSPPANEKPWERLWANSNHPAYVIPQGPGVYTPGTDAEIDYFTFVRDRVRKIQVGILLLGPSSPTGDLNPITGNAFTTEKLILEARLANSPWIRTASTGIIPGTAIP